MNKPSETPTGMELMMDAAPSILDVLARKDALIRQLERSNVALLSAAEFALAVLWGSNSDKKGATKALEAAVAKVKATHEQ